MSNIYFIKPIGMDGPIKIGFSTKPIIRLETLSTWSPFPLEIIGHVPGKLEDETFIHQCFSDVHTHREWFLSTPALRSAIQLILNAGTVDAIRQTLIPKDGIKNRSRKPRSAAAKLQTSYKMRIVWATKRLRGNTPPTEAYYKAPPDVEAIVRKWDYCRGQYEMPSEAEIARLDDFLANASDQAIRKVIARILPAAAA
jgi:hypothetical protein